MLTPESIHWILYDMTRREADSHRYYDFAEAVKIALRDRWGVADSTNKTAHQVAAEAAEADYQRIKGWCEDRWHYVGVVVTLLDVEGHKTHLRASLWGIESDEERYQEQVAQELAEEIAAQVGDSDVITRRVRVAK